MKKIPIKLTRDPILETIFELRYLPKVPSVSDLLPGLLYPKFKDRFKTPERLPGADIPKQILAFNPELMYQPRMRLTGDKFSIYLGDKSTTVSCPKPYVGWKEFRPLILEVITELKTADVIENVERFSLKYVNLLESNDLKEQFGFLRMSAKLGNYDLTEWLTAINTEIKEDGLVNLIELKGGTTATMPNSKGISGLLISVDTISISPDAFWDRKEELIEKVHSKEKQIFFDLLSEETTKKLGAIWS